MNLPYHTANVLMTHSAEVIESLLPGTFKGITAIKKGASLSEIKNNSKAFVFGPGGDSGLVSFESSWRSSGGGKSVPVTTIKLIDPSKEFEQRFMDTGFGRGMEKFTEGFRGVPKSKRTHHNPMDHPTGFDPNTLPGIPTPGSHSTGAGAHFLGVVVDPWDRTIGATEEDRKQGFEDERVVITDMIKKHSLIAGSRPVYIAFGSGPDISTWSIMALNLFSANLEVHSGAREITLEFVWPGYLTHEDKQKQGVKKKSIYPFPMPNGHDLIFRVTGKPLDQYLLKSSPSIGGGDDFVLGGPPKPYFDWHRVLVDLLENYLKMVRQTDAAIVLLPDVNKILGDRIRIIEDQYEDYGDRIQNYQKALRNAAKGWGQDPWVATPEQAAEALTDRDKSTVLIHMSYAIRFLKLFGFHLEYDSKEIISKGQVFTGGGNNAGILNAKFRDEQNSFDHIKKKSKVIPTISQAITTEEAAVLKDPNRLHALEIRTVLDNFEKGFWSATYAPTFTNTVEYNVKILKIWKDVLGVGNGVDPVAVYGDTTLIDKLLYHKEDYIIPDPNLSTGVGVGGARHGITPSRFMPGPGFGPDPIPKDDVIKLKTLKEALDPETLTKYQKEQLDHEMKKLEKHFGEIGGGRESPLTGKGQSAYLLHKDDTALKIATGYVRSDAQPRFNNPIDSKKLQDAMIAYNKIHNNTIPSHTLVEGATKLASHLGFPIFRVNVPGANVTEVNITNENFYHNALTAGYNTRLYPIAVDKLLSGGRASWPYTSQTLSNSDSIISRYFSDKENQSVDKLKEILSEELGKGVGVVSPADADLFTAFAIALFLQNNAAIKNTNYSYLAVPIPKWVSTGGHGLNPMSLQMSILDQITKNSFIVEVKTLPAFSFNGNAAMNKECLLVMRDMDVHGVSREEVTYGRDTLYSGLYIILGFEHVISADDAYSKFTMRRIPSRNFTEEQYKSMLGIK